MKVRLLSLNAGLLQLFGCSVPALHVPERFELLARRLREVSSDIVLLQEVYGHSRRSALAESLAELFPFAIYPRRKRILGLENALMTLSRFPASGELELFEHAPIDEALFDSKGILITHHQISDNVTLNILNLHTTAGGIFNHPEHQVTDTIRARQINQVLEKAIQVRTPLILAGDLNAGPGVSEANFRQILDAGFTSIYDLLHGSTSEPTWDPENPLNRAGPHKHCPPQRIDHFFVRNCELSKAIISPVSSSICMKETVVQIAEGPSVSVSDHFGVHVELEIRTNDSDGSGLS